MWWSYWPATWFLLVPLMMVACMAGMFLMMRGMHGRHHPKSAGIGTDVARAGAPLTAPFAEEASPFEEYRADTLRRLDREQTDFRDFAERLRNAKDKAEFDEFMAQLNARTASPSGLAAEGGAHDDRPGAVVYICPMHANVRQALPGRCPTCGMNLVPEGARFKLVRHMLGNPMHIAVMAAIMIGIMAAAMTMMR